MAKNMVALHDGERTIARVRKHWLVFVTESFGLLLAAFVPFVLLAIPVQFVMSVFPELAGARIGALVAFIATGWELAVFVVFMILLTTYYLDVIIVTNKRILDVDQVGLFARDVASLPIEKLEDIKIETIGILAEIFKFGDLHIQSAAQAKEVQIKGIRNPEHTRDLIMHAYHVNKHEPQ